MVSLAKRFWSSGRPGATGAVDVMIDVRGNFFYTRTVPCQLWFFDRAKERDAARCDFILMLDARGIYRKVTRAIVDFSPEQPQNSAAIVWLCRGQRERFLALVQRYLQAATDHAQASTAPVAGFLRELEQQVGRMRPFADAQRGKPEAENFNAGWDELLKTRDALAAEAGVLADQVTAHAKARKPEPG